MSKVYTFLADGFEMVEALAVVDILKRAGIEVITVSVKDTLEVESSHKVTIKADTLFNENSYDDGSCVFLPGGMPGTRNLEAHEGLTDLIKKYYEGDKYLAAICAAPSVFGHMGLLEGKNATCFPGFEKDLYGATATGNRVEQAGKIITSKGMGTAIDLGLKLVEIFISAEKSEEIAKSTQYK